MRSNEFNKKQVVRYLLWTFAAAYLVQFLSASLYNRNRQAGQLVLAAMMFVPTLGVILSGAGFHSGRLVRSSDPDRRRGPYLLPAFPRAL